MREINFKDENGNNINISLMGFFRVPQLEKEFIMYSLVDDDETNEDGHVILGEVVREGGDVQILGIESNEKDLVVAYYNEIETQLGGNIDE